MKILMEFGPNEFYQAVKGGSVLALLNDMANSETEARDIANAMKETSLKSKSEPKPEPEKTQEVPPEEPGDPEYTLEQVRATYAEISRKGKTDEVRKIITSYGVKRLTDIPEDKYGELMEKAEGLK